MITKSVAVSGTVGKQVYPTSGYGKDVILKGFNIAKNSTGAAVTIRYGNASGAIAIEASSIVSGGTSIQLSEEGYKFNAGMHVKVLGTGAICYLWIE